MISIQSKVHIDSIKGVELLDFLLNCTDEQYQAWWPGTHLAFHTVERRPDHVGSVIYMDEYVGRRRLRMKGIVTEFVPGKRVVWQFKQIVRLPAWLVLVTEDKEAGVTITHTIQAGFPGMGRILDPVLRLYFTDEFERAMDEHAQAEFPMLAAMLRDM
ncbi:MAG: hypothetical protein M8467_11310 [Anaerolineae bacterium]|nr:hypothetical protein [Anaerolineae bacterium]